MTRLVCHAVLIALVLSVLGCKSKPPAQPAAPAGPDVKVKAGDLIKEYADNAIAADAKYKGKVVQVTGKFNSAPSMVVVGYIVQIAGDDADELNSSFVQCTLEEGAAKDLAKFQKGQPITMQGTCDGTPVPGQVKMSKCIVVK